MVIVGIDLSGPSNFTDAALVAFAAEGLHLNYLESVCGADDQRLFDVVSTFSDGDGAIVGIDAPLSYNPGGGDRPGDRVLRGLVIDAGLEPGSVMPPTMTRMAYLTLRGVCVARALERIGPTRPRVVEVHPGASLALHGAPIAAVRTFKREVEARHHLLKWFMAQGLVAIPTADDPTAHFVAACACAMAAWKWASNGSLWCHRAAPPLHPYDFAC